MEAIANMLPFRSVLAASLLTCTLAGPALAEGDAANGQKVFRRCMACHMIDQETNRLGPHLRGVYGRPAGTVEGYTYSEGFAAADFVWDEATLDPWLADPMAMIPGTKMVLKLAKPEDRADVIAYLKSLNGQ
jgi:cytochrome c